MTDNTLQFIGLAVTGVVVGTAVWGSGLTGLLSVVTVPVGMVLGYWFYTVCDADVCGDTTWVMGGVCLLMLVQYGLA